MSRRLTALAVISMLSLQGCAIGLEHIDVQYAPAAPAQPVAGAAQAPVTVQAVMGAGAPADRVGVKKNGYGIEMGGLAPTRPVPDIVSAAFVQELQLRGFAVRDGGATVRIEVERFRNDFKPGFFSASAEADVTLAVTVRSAAGAILYARTATGHGTMDGLIAMTPGIARQTLDKALAESVGTVVADPAFVTALLGTGGPSPVAGTPPES